MKAAFYAANMQGMTWLKPVHDITGGTLCTDRETTLSATQSAWPQSNLRYFESGKKWSLRRTRGDSKTTLSQREDHVQLAQIARELAPDVVVTTANFPHYIRRGGFSALRQGGSFPKVKQAQMFHGISSKNNKFKPFMANYDLLLFVGQRDKDRFEKLGVLDKTKWRLVGLPRADKIIRGEANRDDVLKKLQLSRKPTVLYAPTHGALSSFFEWGFAVCQSVPRDCNLIIKPHPLIARGVATGSADSAVWQQLLEYSNEREGCAFLDAEADATGADIEQIMVAADVLITDFSSAAEEFLLFDKPLIFANHLSQSQYHETRGEWHEIHGCGDVVTEKSGLARAVGEALSLPQKNAGARQNMRDYVFHELDGNAAQRAADALTRLCRGEL